MKRFILALYPCPDKIKHILIFHLHSLNEPRKTVIQLLLIVSLLCCPKSLSCRLGCWRKRDVTSTSVKVTPTRPSPTHFLSAKQRWGATSSQAAILRPAQMPVTCFHLVLTQVLVRINLVSCGASCKVLDAVCELLLSRARTRTGADWPLATNRRRRRTNTA